MSRDEGSIAGELAGAGFIAAEAEAVELVAAAAGDPALLDVMVARRLDGEPLAWITGVVTFAGVELRVPAGVYVPRWHTEALARRAAERLPERGVGVDGCTGTGAVARVMATRRPQARVVGTDLDPAAVEAAAANGIEAYAGDLLAPVPAELDGAVDVIVAVVPYVPTPALGLLPRDTFVFESDRPYDGGPDGTVLLRRLAVESTRLLRPGGALLLELGGDQADPMADHLGTLGFGEPVVLTDDEGDVRGLEATLLRRR